ISLIAILLISLMNSECLKWFKYAGDWSPEGPEPWSYTFQRWWLNCTAQDGVVTVNGHWPGQQRHVHSFFNPSLTDAEVKESQNKGLVKQLASPMRLLFVGRLEQDKGAERVLRILLRLKQLNIPAMLDLAGDGPQPEKVEGVAAELGIRERSRFHGWLPRPALNEIYALAHVLLLPSCTEGWPKVLSEGMAYGVVPVSSKVGSIPQSLRAFRTGRTFEHDDLEGFVK